MRTFSTLKGIGGRACCVGSVPALVELVLVGDGLVSWVERVGLRFEPPIVLARSASACVGR